MLAVSTVFAGWVSAFPVATVSDPVWLAAWGVGLIGAATMFRRVGARTGR